MTTDPINSPSAPAAWLLVSRGMDSTGALSIAAISEALWRGRRWVVGSTLILTSLAITYALVIPKLYETSSIVSVVQDADTSVANRVGLSELSSLAGLSLDHGGHRSEYVALLSSRLVATRFLEEKNLLPALFPNRWDPERKQWTLTWLHRKPPTMNDAVRKFLRDILTVKEDRMTGLVTVRIRWRDPNVAAEWANELVEQVNEQARGEALEEAKRSLEFLRRELDETPNLPVRDSIYRLMEANLNRKMMANVQEQFALKTIDPAMADPRKVVRPLFVFDVIIAFLAGAFLGSLLAIWRFPASASATAGPAPRDS
jgi:uncharacterized protein involved in exopolysaccharide biosynthesis